MDQIVKRDRKKIFCEPKDEPLSLVLTNQGRFLLSFKNAMFHTWVMRISLVPVALTTSRSQWLAYQNPADFRWVWRCWRWCELGVDRRSIGHLDAEGYRMEEGRIRGVDAWAGRASIGSRQSDTVNPGCFVAYV